METSKVMQETVQEPEMVDEEYPDEIECQLIQKSVFIGGQVQTIDFIMCNQCPRLFRTENLLWNHIKAKHKRRSYRKFGSSPGTYDQFRRHSSSGRSQVPGELEPGEIDRPVMSPPANVPRSPVKSESVQKEGVFVVGLEKSGQTRPGPGRPAMSPEKLLRQKTRKRIYVDSNQGPFKCPGCDNVNFSNRRSLELHMKRLHKAGIVECDECGRKVLDLKRHKEILHKRFKIFDCPHCNDKFCTQDDMERHLAKVEKNNMVEGGNRQKTFTKIKEALPAETKVEKSIEKEKETKDTEVENTDKEKENTVNTAAGTKTKSPVEFKTFSCSECGMKTHSRMTYIQHVLNGCIMDMVLGENGENVVERRTPAKRGRKPGSRGPGRPPKVQKVEV